MRRLTMIYYEVDSGCIRKNIEVIKKRAGVPIWAVIKYDGYGVGLCAMADIVRSCGVLNFAVSEVEDLVKLREAGFTDVEILVLSPHPGKDVETVLQNGGIFTIGDLSFAAEIEKAAAALGVTAKAHVKIDTGLSRFGFFPNDYDKIRSVYTDYEHIDVLGIYSHFASAFAAKPDVTHAQIDKFKSVLAKLEADGIDRGMAHIANSPGLFRFEGTSFDAVRVGSALLGRVTGSSPDKTGLFRTGRLVTTVCQIRMLPKGTLFGYGGTFKVKSETPVAIVAGGPWSGVVSPRFRQIFLKHYNTAQFGDKRLPIIGSDGDGQTVLDVTGVDIHPGDTVIIDINPLELNPSIKKVII